VKIHVLGINFYPELIGISVYTTEMCEYLIEKGHEITVFTGFPYYPSWRIKEDYKRKLFKTEEYKNIKIRRSYIFVPKNLKTINRIVHELSFIISSFLNVLFSKRPNILITISPPLGLGIATLLISKIMRIPYIFHVQDLQPDAVVELGMIDNKLLLKILYYIEGMIYKGASKVSAISNGMIKKIMSKGISRDKVLFFPNWVDIDFIKPQKKYNVFRKVNKLENKYIVLYSGNIGYKQGLDIILNVAQKTSKINDILYLIVGDGTYKKELIKKFKKTKPNNVKFLDVQSKEMLPYMVSAADVCLVLQKKDVTDFALPSKLLNIMGCARPVIACANTKSALYGLIGEIGCGKVVRPGDADQLCKEVLELYFNKEQGEVYGRRGRDFVVEHLSKDLILKRFEEEIISSLGI